MAHACTNTTWPDDGNFDSTLPTMGKFPKVDIGSLALGYQTGGSPDFGEL